MDTLHLILQNEWLAAFGEMDDAALGKVIKALCAYHLELTVPADLSGETKAFLFMMKPFLDLNRERYEKACEAGRENGKKGGRPRKKKTAENAKTGGVFSKTEKNHKPKRTPKRSPTGTPSVSDETEKESERESAALPPFPSLTPARAPDLPSNVILTEEERGRLEALYPDKWRELVEHFSTYLFNHPEKRYLRHFETIRDWARRDGVPEADGSVRKTYDLDDFFEAAAARALSEEETDGRTEASG